MQHDPHTILISLIPAEQGQDLHLTLSQAEAQRLIPAENTAEVASDLALDLHLQRRPATGRVVVRGRARADMTLACSRCIQPIPWRLDADIHVTLLPRAQQPTEDELELRDEDLDVGFYADDTLSADDILRETLLLELPTFPLCQEDCAGLCPQCGRSLSEGAAEPCACPPTPTHLGLAALQERLKS
jgi:uncharacterized protein